MTYEPPLCWRWRLLSVLQDVWHHNTNISHILSFPTVQTYHLFSVFGGKAHCREKVDWGTVPLSETCLFLPEPDHVTSELLTFTQNSTCRSRAIICALSFFTDFSYSSFFIYSPLPPSLSSSSVVLTFHFRTNAQVSTFKRDALFFFFLAFCTLYCINRF